MLGGARRDYGGKEDHSQQSLDVALIEGVVQAVRVVLGLRSHSFVSTASALPSSLREKACMCVARCTMIQSPVFENAIPGRPALRSAASVGCGLV